MLYNKLVKKALVVKGKQLNYLRISGNDRWKMVSKGKIHSNRTHKILRQDAIVPEKNSLRTQMVSNNINSSQCLYKKAFVLGGESSGVLILQHISKQNLSSKSSSFI